MHGLELIFLACQAAYEANGPNLKLAYESVVYPRARQRAPSGRERVLEENRENECGAREMYAC